MFAGGCGFSTAGGIKIFRLMQMSNVVLFVRRSTRSNMSKDEKKEMMTAVLLICISLNMLYATSTPHIESISGDFSESYLEAVGLHNHWRTLSAVVHHRSGPSIMAATIGMSFLMIFGIGLQSLYIWYPRLDCTA